MVTPEQVTSLIQSVFGTLFSAGTFAMAAMSFWQARQARLKAEASGVQAEAARIQATAANATAQVTQSKVDDVHLEMNSMKDALVKATGEASLAQGRLEGIAHEQQRTSEPPSA